MDERFVHAQQLIRAAKAAHDPPAGALERARARLDRAMAAQQSSALGASATRQSWWRGGAKFYLASIVIGLIGVGALYVGNRVPSEPPNDFAAPVRDRATAVERAATPAAARSTSSSQDAPPPERPRAEHMPGPSPEVPQPKLPASPSQASATPPVPASKPVPGSKHGPGFKHAPDLEGEMRILTDAAEAVDQKDFSRAQALLRIHRDRFGAGQLKRERVGLQVLLQCLEQRPNAAKHARAYLHSAPYALLSARIQAACSIK